VTPTPKKKEKRKKVNVDLTKDFSMNKKMPKVTPCFNGEETRTNVFGQKCSSMLRKHSMNPKFF